MLGFRKLNGGGLGVIGDCETKSENCFVEALEAPARPIEALFANESPQLVLT